MGSEGLKKEELNRYLLEVERLSLSFKREPEKIMALKEVSLQVKEGEILALVGESGCGKSVFCRTVLGFLPDRAKAASGLAERKFYPVRRSKWTGSAGIFFRW